MKALSEISINSKILHTGQHYDHSMSGVFFEELGISKPDWNLNCGGGRHGEMTGMMLAEIEEILVGEQPRMVVVFGDTNSTLAGALAAAKMHIPVAHVEAGLRSGNRRMPEELNRICTDHLSDLLFCSSDGGRAQLASEGITSGVYVTGDVMADAFHAAIASVKHQRPKEPFALLTLHRAGNTDDAQVLKEVFLAAEQSGMKIVFPVHPRTKKLMMECAITPPPNVECRAPGSYHETISLLAACEFVLTDSGGLQKEAYWAGKPCLTLREETEWTELITSGWNVLTGTAAPGILRSMKEPPRGANRIPLYGDGHAAERVAQAVASFLS